MMKVLEDMDMANVVAKEFDQDVGMQPMMLLPQIWLRMSDDRVVSDVIGHEIPYVTLFVCGVCSWLVGCTNIVVSCLLVSASCFLPLSSFEII